MDVQSSYDTSTINILYGNANKIMDKSSELAGSDNDNWFYNSVRNDWSMGSHTRFHTC